MAEDQAINLPQDQDPIPKGEALLSSGRTSPSRRFLPSPDIQLLDHYSSPSPLQGAEHPPTGARFLQSPVLRTSLHPDLQNPKRARETTTEDASEAEFVESSSRGPKRQRTAGDDRSWPPISRWNSPGPAPAATGNRRRIIQDYRQQSPRFLPASPAHHNIYQVRHELEPHAANFYQLSSAVTSGGNPTGQPQPRIPLPVPVLEKQGRGHLAPFSIEKKYELVLDEVLTNQMRDNFHYYKPLRSWGINREFSYNEFGVLHENIFFDHESLKRFLLDHPLKDKLTIRIQKNPAFRSLGALQKTAVHMRSRKELVTTDKGKVSEKERWDHTNVLKMSEFCRFATCASKDNVIKASEPKVCFDEESGRGDGSTLKHNPYRAAGYMHVGCFEKAIRLSEVARYFNIKVDQLKSGPSKKNNKKNNTEDRSSSDEEPDEDLKKSSTKKSSTTDSSQDNSRDKLLKLDTNIGYRVDRWLWYAETHPNWDPVSLLETLEFVLRCAKFYRRRSRLKEKLYRKHITPLEPVNYLMHSMSCMDAAGEDQGCLRWDKFADKSTKKDVDSMRMLDVIVLQERFIAVYSENLRILREEYAQAYNTYQARYEGTGTELRLQDMSEAINKLVVDQICKKYRQVEVRKVERDGQQTEESRVVGERAVLLALKNFYDHSTMALPGYGHTPTAPKRKSAGAKGQAKQEKKGKQPQAHGFLDAVGGGQPEIPEPTTNEAWEILSNLKEELYTPRIYWEAGDLIRNKHWGGARTVGGQVEKTRKSPPKLPLKEALKDNTTWEPVNLEEYGDYFSIFPAILREYEDKTNPDAKLPSNLDIEYLYDHIPINPTPPDGSRGTRIHYRVKTKDLSLNYPVRLDPDLGGMEDEQLLSIARLPRGLPPLPTHVTKRIRITSGEDISQRDLSMISNFNHDLSTVDPKMMSTDSPMSSVPDLIDDDGSDYDDDEEPPMTSWETTIDPALQDHLPTCQTRGPPEYAQEVVRNEYYPRVVDEDYNESPGAYPATPASGHALGREDHEEVGPSMNHLKFLETRVGRESSPYGTAFAQSYDHEDHHDDDHDPQSHHDGGESLFSQEMGLLNQRD